MTCSRSVYSCHPGSLNATFISMDAKAVRTTWRAAAAVSQVRMREGMVGVERSQVYRQSSVQLWHKSQQVSHAWWLVASHTPP